MKSSDFVASYLRASAFDRLTFWLFHTYLKGLANLPLNLARRLGKHLGSLIYGLDLHWKPKALERIKVLLDPPDPDLLLRSLYQHFGMILAEMAHRTEIVRRWTTFFEFTGEEYTSELRSGGVIVTAHLGNWEIFAAGHVRRFGPVAALVKPIRNAYFHYWVTAVRLSLGVQPLSVRYEAWKILNHLKSRGKIVVLLDQNSLRDEGVFTHFFGRLACTHYGPVLLALRAGVPLMTAYGVRTPEGNFCLTYEPPLPLPPFGDIRERLWFLTQDLTSRIESWVRRYPDQWLWIHDRFRTKPDEKTPAWKLPPSMRGVETSAILSK